MEQKKSSLVIIFAILSLLIGLLGFVMSFLPLRIFAIFPASIGLALGAFAYFIARRQNAKKLFTYIALGLSTVSIVIALSAEAIFTNEITEDTEFEKRIETTTEGTDDDLMEALGDIESEDEIGEENIEAVEEE